jgi:histidinol-phosphate aminotransferase
VRRTGAEIARLTGRLRAAGLRVAPSAANFLFIDTGRDATEVVARLRGAGIIVKAWREPGYQSFIRASLSTPEDDDVFVARLLEICGRREP